MLRSETSSALLGTWQGESACAKKVASTVEASGAVEQLLVEATKHVAQLNAENQRLVATLEREREKWTLAQPVIDGLKAELTVVTSQLMEARRENSVLCSEMNVASQRSEATISAVRLLKEEQADLKLLGRHIEGQLQRQQQRKLQQQPLREKEQLKVLQQSISIHQVETGSSTCTSSGCSDHHGPVTDPSVALRLRRAEAALVAIVPELEHKLEDKSQALAEAELRVTYLEAQLHDRGHNEQQQRQQQQGQKQQEELQVHSLMARLEERDIALAEAEQKLRGLQKQLDQSLHKETNKKERQLQLSWESASGIGIRGG